MGGAGISGASAMPKCLRHAFGVHGTVQAGRTVVRNAKMDGTRQNRDDRALRERYRKRGTSLGRPHVEWGSVSI